MAGITKVRALNLMLIGKTGDGKSATGNTILGDRFFTESSRTSSVTTDVVCKFERFDNIPVKVVDSPGIMGTDMDSGQDKTAAGSNMATAIGMCDGGVDAFIFCIKRERFTPEKRKSIEDMKKIFGERYTQNLIVAVTCGDMFKKDMEHEGRGSVSFKEWCRQESGAFKQLYDEFSDRFLLINNREEDPQKKEAQRREIIQLADTLRKLNGRYTSTSFEEAKAARDKLIVQENLPMLNESLQMKVGLLVADLLKLKKSPTDTERDGILQSLNDLKQEITEKDKGTGLLNHLMANVQQMKNALHDVDELHRLATEMEKIREAKSTWSRYGKIATGLMIVGGIAAVAALVPLTVVAAPIVIPAVAACAVASATNFAVGGSGSILCLNKESKFSKDEKQTGAKINALDKKVTKAMKYIKK